MNMNINAIKYEFTQYLIETGQISGTEKLSSSEVNIFSYSSQFKDFLKKEGIIDEDLSSKNLSDILQMNIDDNGKFVGDEFEKHTESDEANSKNQKEDIFAQIYNELLDNKEFFNAMDSDGNGEISKDEQKLFLEIIENLDGNKDISIDDLLLASDTIKDNKFNELKNLFNNDNNDNTALNNNSSGGISSSISSNPYVNNNVMPKEEKKSIENMSQPELESELESEQSSLQTNKDLLDSYVNGTGPGLDSYKEAMETAYSEYKTELESVAPELVQQMEQIETAISDKENEISAQEQAITLQEAKYTEACNTYDTISATVTSLTQLVQELQAIDREGLTPEQTSTIDANLKEAEKQLATATQKQGEALTNKETQNNLLTEEKDKLDTFYKGEDGLNALNAAKQTLEETISLKEQTQLTELMNKYNKAKTEYTTQKNSFISQAQKAVIDSQKRIGDINSALNNYDNKATRRELSFNTLFSSDVDYTYEVVEKDGMIPYLVIKPTDINPNEELPTLLYLHGSGEIGKDGDYMINGSNKNLLPYNIMANEKGFKNFNGIIICPMINYGNWENETIVNQISNILDNTPNIDQDRIAVAGHSLGGRGAEYLAKNLPSRFCSLAVLSGYDTGIDVSQLGIPVTGYVGQNDSEYMTTTFAQRVGSDRLFIQKGVDHGGVPRSAFLSDSNGDECSDFFEMIFGDM